MVPIAGYTPLPCGIHWLGFLDKYPWNCENWELLIQVKDPYDLQICILVTRGVVLVHLTFESFRRRRGAVVLEPFSICHYRMVLLCLVHLIALDWILSRHFYAYLRADYTLPSCLLLSFPIYTTLCLWVFSAWLEFTKVQVLRSRGQSWFVIWKQW